MDRCDLSLKSWVSCTESSLRVSASCMHCGSAGAFQIPINISCLSMPTALSLTMKSEAHKEPKRPMETPGD